MDIVGLDRFGRTAEGISPVAPQRHVIYGTEVKAPCSGSVALTRSGVPDMPVPKMDRDNMTGNSVLLACGDFYVLLAHLAPRSLTVTEGDSVTVGQTLGRVGNSGNTAAPHLHIHVQREMPAKNPLSGTPLFFTIEGRFLVRNDRFAVER
ncbi:M23 family metallopeptidase [Pseudahrensia aquimaris]|uniref:M23 family metallopeptidase n=1 Tax=Pseudahrensia aquimaris TaxID=744461 RepID=UPI00366D3A5F